MTAALEGGELSAARPGRNLPPGKTRYPFYRRLGGPKGRSGLAENLAPTGIFFFFKHLFKLSTITDVDCTTECVFQCYSMKQTVVLVDIALHINIILTLYTLALPIWHFSEHKLVIWSLLYITMY